MQTPPYRGQGKPLPREMGPGVWVIEDSIHMTFVGSRLLTRQRTCDDGAKRCAIAGIGSSLGINAQRLCEVLAVPFTELLEANRRGLLHVATRTAVDGREAGVWFGARYGERRVQLMTEVIEVACGALEIDARRCSVRAP